MKAYIWLNEKDKDEMREFKLTQGNRFLFPYFSITIRKGYDLFRWDIEILSTSKDLYNRSSVITAAHQFPTPPPGGCYFSPLMKISKSPLNYFLQCFYFRKCLLISFNIPRKRFLIIIFFYINRNHFKTFVNKMIDYDYQ